MSELAETPPERIQPALSETDWPDWSDQNNWRTHLPEQALRRDGLSRALSAFSRQLVWNPFALGAHFDALHPAYVNDLKAALLQQAEPVFSQLCHRLDQADEQRVLRNVAAWAAFRKKPLTGSGRSRSTSTTPFSTNGLSLSDNSGPPLAGTRLCVLTAALASAMRSGDANVRDLAHHVCQQFIEAAGLTGHWAGVFRLLGIQDDSQANHLTLKPFPCLHEARFYLTDSERVRLKLYWQHHQRRLNVLRLIDSVAYLPGISWQIKSREIRRFLQTRRDIGKPLSPLRPRHLEWLRERELRLLVRRPELLDALIDSTVAAGAATTEQDTLKKAMRQSATDLLERYTPALRYLQRLRRAIDIRNWPIASECISDIQRLNPPRRWIHLQLRFAACDEKGRMDFVPDMDADSSSRRAWKPMLESDLQWLQTHVSASALARMKIGIPPSLDVQQATDALLERRIASDRVTPLEMQLLFNAMSVDQWRAIDAADRTDLVMDHGPLWQSYDLDKALLLAARSGCGQATVMHRAGHARSIAPLLRQMACAQAQGLYAPKTTGLLTIILKGRSEMGKDRAQPWYLPLIGLPAWRALERHFVDAQPALTDALLHAKAKGRIYNRAGYFDRLAHWNTHVGQVFPADLFETWCELARKPAQDAFKPLPLRQASLLLADIEQSPALLASLPHLHHAQLQSDILVARAWRARDEEVLWSLITDPMWTYRPHRNSKAARVPAHLCLRPHAPDASETPNAACPSRQHENPSPSVICGSDAILDLHIAFVRQDPHALKHLGKHTETARLESALLRVAKRLTPTHPRDAAFLQLLALLGSDLAAQLAALLAQAGKSRRDKPPEYQSVGYALDALYDSRDIPKRNGKVRTLLIPHPMLKRVQQRIVQRVLNPLGAHRCATGFVEGRSIADNAIPHTHQALVASCDIQNCFPSISARLVWRVLSRDLAHIKGHELSSVTIRWLAQICCARGALPIGAPTSPALLNRVLAELDQWLADRAERLACRYTRYADDLCFSGGRDCLTLIGQANRKLGHLGLMLDPGKTNLFRRGRRQMVTGLCVNDGIQIPRTQRRLLRAALHRAAAIDRAQSLGQTIDSLPKPVLNGTELNHQRLQGHVAWHDFIKRKRHAAQS